MLEVDEETSFWWLANMSRQVFWSRIGEPEESLKTKVRGAGTEGTLCEESLLRVDQRVEGSVDDVSEEQTACQLILEAVKISW